jgi:hypothetical protein
VNDITADHANRTDDELPVVIPPQILEACDSG